MRWSQGNSRRDDVYRVDRELAQMKFFAGEALKKTTRSKYEPSHQVYIEGDWIKFRLYKTVIAERNLITGELKFRHGGWTTMETGKDLIPLFRHYFGNHACIYRDKNEYWVTRGKSYHQRTGDQIAVGKEGLTFTPKSFGVWEITDESGETYIWDLTVSKAS